MLAVGPWPIGFLIPDDAAPRPVVAIVCCAASLISLILLLRLLRPISATARGLRELALADGADACAFDVADEFETISQGVAHLKGRVDAMKHRWAWRHAVTGLPVRESLIRSITEDLERSDRPGLLGAIRFVDYDRLLAFDPCSAEDALQRFSERLAASLGSARPMAHVDRDRFAIWFRNADPDQTLVELRALSYALGAEITVGTLSIIPDVEIGMARYPADAGDPAGLINHALVSLTRSGEDTIAASSPGKSAESARERFSMEQDLRQAIDRRQLEMAYQPIVHLSKGVVGAEALVRWRHPDLGLISPSRFIPILEDADLIDELGRWTLNAACRELRRWRQQGLDHLKVAVNLSANQLRDPDLQQTIQRTVERHRLKPQMLELELTETAATEDAERTFVLFRELRALGIGLAIDDFGSGYSSLSYVKNLPFDKLKIDREFVVDVHLRRDSQAICRALVELTRGLDLEILAEGVESWDEVEMLASFGCRTFQGFLFSQPLNSDQFAEIALDPIWRAPLQRPSGRSAEQGRLSA